MLPVSRPGATIEGSSVRDVIHDVVETLAPLERRACSPGEREAADWLAARLRAVAGTEVTLEDEPSWGTFPPTATALGVVGILAGVLAVRGRRVRATLLAGLAVAGIVDEAQNGPRIVRRLLRRRRTTVNVIASMSSREPASPRPAGTLVVLAHHDAPQTGLVFDQTLQRRLYEVAPQVLERFKTPFPNWWLGLSGPVAVGASGVLGRRRLARTGLALGVLTTALVADMWRSETVQGANDNLSGVASLVALAEMLRERPLPGLRVLLVSCGAEETLQDGIRAFLARHRGELDPERTCFVNLDAVGSPHLVMLEAEGPVWMEPYAGPWLSDLVEECAARAGIELERGYRARASTDSVIPSRAGYPIATLVSITDWRAPANYHLPSDVPANLDYDTVEDAARLVYEVARALVERAGAAASTPVAAA
jgi:hypothetical protein